MGGLDTHDELERGALLAPTSPEQGSTPSPPAPKRECSTSAWNILWTLAFYAPSAVIPLAARLLVVYRDEAVVGLASLLKGAAFGALQDAAIFFQTLFLARVVLSFKTALIRSQHYYRNALVYATLAVALAFAYLWMTLATLVDLSLILNYLPRLNRGFVEMYVDFAAQFTSSLADAMTTNIIFGLAFYTFSMFTWILSVLLDKVSLPTFGIFFCQTYRSSSSSSSQNSSSSSRSGESSAKPTPVPQRKTPTISSTGIFSCLVHGVLTSLTFRTLCVALMTSVSALHATLALDGNGNDILYLSNAMFSLETEDLLKAKNAIQFSGEADAAAQVSKFKSSVDRIIGPNEEWVPAAGGFHSAKFPLWRKTIRFRGEKRFEVKINPSRPPNVLLINIESARSREIGVLGGRQKKALYNQTATPFFDELSKSGVLFRQHYTPSIQTSRTIMSSLFGVLPSLTDATAVANSAKKMLNVTGLPHLLHDTLHYNTMFWSAVDLGWEKWNEFLVKHGFDQLWDQNTVLSHLSEERRKSLTDEDKFSWGYHDPVSLEALENFLEARKTKDPDGPPLFMDIYTITSHDPFPKPPHFTPSCNYSTYITKDNEGYVNALNFVDQQLSKFIPRLRRKGLLENTIVLIEGDHGYGRMEHGNNPTIASSRVYEEAVHIPLLILADDLLREEDKGVVVDEVSSQTDLMATVADMLDIKGFMQHGVGQSLVRKQPPVSETVEPRGVVIENPYDGSTIGVRVGPDLKYVRYGSGKYKVYNLTSDPEEMSPVEEGKVDSITNAETEKHIQYASQVVDMAQFMYETNGFMPPPRGPKKAD